jgi:hypothetical protein
MPVFVPFLHLLNDLLADVNISDVSVSVVEHLFSNDPVSAADIQNLRLFINEFAVFMEDGLKLVVLEEPVEGVSLLSNVSVIPVLICAVFVHVIRSNKSDQS